MTTDIAIPRAQYALSGTGPYALPWPYSSGELVVQATVNGQTAVLAAGTDFSLSPSSGASGNLFLTGAWATFSGTLYIQRATALEQGWVGTFPGEKGIEAALDRLTRTQQDTSARVRGGLFVEVANPTVPYAPVAEAAIVWRNGQFQAGPTVGQIEGAAAAAELARLYSLEAALYAGETFPTVGQRRGRINYHSTTALRVEGLPDAIVLGGFRIFGQYLKARGRLLSTALGAASHKIVSILTDLSGLTAPQLNCWYAVFFCGNPGDAAGSFRLVPYFRALSRSGNVVTLARGGENQNITPAAETFVQPTNIWAGVDCLVINENGIFSGRTTKITANTQTTITVADASGIGPLDFLLPVPVGFASYHYLGTNYYESPGDWRNIADSGLRVNSYMATVAEVRATGDAANDKIRFGGNISPLATGYIGSLNETLSTESAGQVAETLAHDSGAHVIWRSFFDKDVTGPTSNLSDNDMVDLSFSKEQACWHTTSGNLEATVAARSILTLGWYEP